MIRNNEMIQYTNMSVMIFITHYKDKTKVPWISNIKYPVVVPQKNTRTTKTIKYNKASLFFKYILDNYESLPDFLVYINGGELHETKTTMDHTLNSFSFENKYGKIYDGDKITTTLPTTSTKEIDFSSKKMKKIIEDIEFILQKRIIGETVESPHFYVHKDNIQFIPKQTYQQIYNYLETTEESPYWTDRIFEYIGQFIFTDQQYTGPIVLHTNPSPNPLPVIEETQNVIVITRSLTQPRIVEPKQNLMMRLQSTRPAKLNKKYIVFDYIT